MSNSAAVYRSLLVFILLGALIGATGYGSYYAQKQVIVNQKEKELGAIADLKAGQIIQWRKERLNDAEGIFGNPMIARPIVEYLAGQPGSRAHAEIVYWMSFLARSVDYRRVLLYREGGEPLIFFPDDSKFGHPEVERLLSEAATKPGIIFTDFHRNKATGDIDIDLIVPIMDAPGNRSRCIAVCVLEMDPAGFLYPLIQSWPTPSESAETLLVRRSEADVLYLNELRHQKNTALTMRLPITREHLPAARAALGQDVIVEGVDYRGVPVLAATRAIAGSPWAIVAKVDTAEIYAPIRRRAWLVTFISSLLTVLAGLSVFLWRLREREGFARTRLEAERRFNAEQAETEKAVRRSEEQLRLLLDSTAEAIYGIDMDGNCTFCNPATLHMLRYVSPEDLAGKNMHWQIHHHRGDGRLFPVEECRIFQAFQRGEGTHADDEVLWRADGSSFPAEYWSYPQKQDGRTVGAVVTFLDITARKETEAALEEAKKTAEDANRAKSTFLANMSHEIRTPLNAILGFAQLIHRDPHIPPHQRQRLATITRSGEHLLKLINEILEMSKIEAGRCELHEEAFDLHALLWDLENLFRVRTDARGLALTLARSPKVPRFVRGDEGKLRQVFINILGNAIKFTDTGGVVVRIEAEWDSVDALVLKAAVKDTGRGVAREDLNKLFDAFVQADAGMRTEGTGLGLTISRQYVRMMGGDIALESAPGEGSTFTFTVRLQSADATFDKKKTDLRRGAGLRADQPAYRILVAADRKDNRDLLTQLLKEAGFDSRAVKDGAAAVLEFATWQPQMVLMEAPMPQLQDHEAIRCIRASERGRRVGIISVSASVFGGSKQEMMALGADDFLGEPFHEHELFDKIRQLLPVEYVYDETDCEAGMEPKRRAALLSREALAALPPDLLLEIRQAALEADLDRALAAIARLETHDAPAAEVMRTLALSYENQTLLEMLSAGGKP